MLIKKLDGYYTIRLEKNEEIISSLEAAAGRKKIKGAFFFGLGVGKDIVLGYYQAHKQTYAKKLFEGEYEFTSLCGNIAIYEKTRIVHCHATITEASFLAMGGHLFQALVPATLELVVFPFPSILARKHDPTTGLRLLNI